MMRLLIALLFLPVLAHANVMIVVDNRSEADPLNIASTPAVVPWSFSDDQYHFALKSGTKLCSNLAGRYVVSYGLSWDTYPTNDTISTVQTSLRINGEVLESSISIETVIYGAATNVNTTTVRFEIGDCIDLWVKSFGPANAPITVTPGRANLIVRS